MGYLGLLTYLLSPPDPPSTNCLEVQTIRFRVYGCLGFRVFGVFVVSGLCVFPG